MPDRSIERERECPLATDACAYVQGELTPADRARFEAHLSSCSLCQEEVAWAQQVIADLRATSPRSGGEADPGHCSPAELDLVPRVLAAVEAEDRSAWSGRRGLLTRPLRAAALAAAAALVAVFAGFLVLRQPAVEHTGDAVERALCWLLKAQEDTGEYRASRWGGEARFDVGLTGLAVLAILAHLPDADDLSPSEPTAASEILARAPAAVDRAVGFLLAAQADDGRFGPGFAGALYNHGIATLALLEAEGLRGDPRLRHPIDRALAYIVRTQAPDGGWGYLGRAGADPNTSASCWPLQALVIARGLGRQGLEGAIDRGFARLARVLDDRGRAGYRRPGEYPYGHFTLTSMSASCVALLEDPAGFPAEARARLFDAIARESTVAPGRDLYRDYFLAFACRRLPRSLSNQWTSAASRAIITAQVDAGRNLGSWEPEDRWASVGGRVCSTALAALILQADRRVERLSSWLAGRNGGEGRSFGGSNQGSTRAG